VLYCTKPFFRALGVNKDVFISISKSSLYTYLGVEVLIITRIYAIVLTNCENTITRNMFKMVVRDQVIS